MKSEKYFLKELKITKRKTKRPVIIAIIGLVGSGKSTISKALAPLIGATVIEGDRIHFLIRKNKEVLDGNKAKISREGIKKVIKGGGNVVLDTDYSQVEKQKKLKDLGASLGAKVIFVRTFVTNQDIIFGRIISAKYSNKDLFGSARNDFGGSIQLRGMIKKAGEVWRRTPRHFFWNGKNGGSWIPRRINGCFQEVNTENEKSWKLKVKKLARKIKSSF